MDWLKEILENEEIKDKIDAISKELPKHFIPKNKYNEQAEKLKEKDEELTTVNAKLDDVINKLPNVENEKETLKTQLETIKSDFETFKSDAEKRVVEIKKKTAVEKGLLEANANPDSVDLLLGTFDYEKIELTQDGKVKGWDDVLTPIKEQRKALFGETRISGGDTTKGKSPEGGGTYATKYQDAMKRGDLKEAIKIKTEAFTKGEKF